LHREAAAPENYPGVKKKQETKQKQAKKEKTKKTTGGAFNIQRGIVTWGLQ